MQSLLAVSEVEENKRFRVTHHFTTTFFL